jgi:phage recombination protein Bet
MQTKAEKDLLHRTVCKGASEDELDIFVATIERTGLDPHARQIYWISRGGKGSIQVSIDGQRSIAERTGELDGLLTDWCGPDAAWVDVWLSKSPPAAARTRVYRKGCTHPFVGIAKWEEYSASGPLWRKMPALMLGKCSQAAAYRCAFPLQLSGLYTPDEMAQAETPPPDIPAILPPVDSEDEATYQIYAAICKEAAQTGEFKALCKAAGEATDKHKVRLFKESWLELKALTGEVD